MKMSKDKIEEKLNKLKEIIIEYENISGEREISDLRSEYNKLRPLVESLAKKMKTMSCWAVSFPAVDYGSPKENLNPFDYVFEELYGLRAITEAKDIIDKTIGALDMMDEIDFSKKEYSNKKIFIVHGHDDAMKLDIANTLRQLDFEPIILNEQANKGQTIIEKIESNSDVGFAVILMSPCDEGYEKGYSKDVKPRARQNVIVELGYFVGRLGRERTFILKKENVAEPSDFSGVVYETYDSKGAWKMQMIKELKAAGYQVDANKLCNI